MKVPRPPVERWFSWFRPWKRCYLLFLVSITIYYCSVDLFAYSILCATSLIFVLDDYFNIYSCIYFLKGARISSTGNQLASESVSGRHEEVPSSDDQNNQYQRRGNWFFNVHVVVTILVRVQCPYFINIIANIELSVWQK